MPGCVKMLFTASRTAGAQRNVVLKTTSRQGIPANRAALRKLARNWVKSSGSARWKL